MIKRNGTSPDLSVRSTWILGKGSLLLWHNENVNFESWMKYSEEAEITDWNGNALILLCGWVLTDKRKKWKKASALRCWRMKVSSTHLLAPQARTPLHSPRRSFYTFIPSLDKLSIYRGVLKGGGVKKNLPESLKSKWKISTRAMIGFCMMGCRNENEPFCCWTLTWIVLFSIYEIVHWHYMKFEGTQTHSQDPTCIYCTFVCVQ